MAARKCWSLCKTQYRNVSGLLAALKQCSKKGELERGKALHLEAIEAKFHTNRCVANALVIMYSKCGSMRDAKNVFESILHPDVVLWTNLILGYVENGESSVAMELFTDMDCEPDAFTFVAALKACKGEKHSDRQFLLENGMIVHERVRKLGLEKDVFVATNLIEMYSKCGSMRQARAVFDSMSNRNVVSWTSLIMGYVENGEISIALELFTSMDCEPNSVTFIAAIKACTSEKHLLEKGMAVHKQARKCGFDTDILVGSNLIEMYSKFGCLWDARAVFDTMFHRNIVSWTSLILGYMENGESSSALDLFTVMDCDPDSTTYVAALKACGSIAAYEDGRGINIQIYKLGLEHNQLLATALVDFYGKCSYMTTSEQAFNSMHSPNIVTWNALLAGYSSVGNTHRVFSLVDSMQESGVQVNGIAFVSVLTACSHAGMVEEGKKYFETMLKYNVTRTMEHYHCMVDMLGRANRLEEALSIIDGMPFEANDVTWTTLLAACRRTSLLAARRKLSSLEAGLIAFDGLATCKL